MSGWMVPARLRRLCDACTMLEHANAKTTQPRMYPPLTFLETKRKLSMAGLSLSSVLGHVINALLFITTAAARHRNGSYVHLRSPSNSDHAQGTTTFLLHSKIALKWDSTLSPLNCDVYQGPNHHGDIVQQQVFRECYASCPSPCAA